MLSPEGKVDFHFCLSRHVPDLATYRPTSTAMVLQAVKRIAVQSAFRPAVSSGASSFTRRASPLKFVAKTGVAAAGLGVFRWGG